jgi:hypothetical protein
MCIVAYCLVVGVGHSLAWRFHNSFCVHSGWKFVEFSTIRMGPVGMALGQATGTAAFLASSSGATPRVIPVRTLQLLLLRQEQVLTVLGEVHQTMNISKPCSTLGRRDTFPPSRCSLIH